MKRLGYGILILLLVFSFSGCSSKPSEDDVLKSCNNIFTPIDNLYEKNGIYVMKVVPHFEIQKDFSKKHFLNMEFRLLLL